MIHETWLKSKFHLHSCWKSISTSICVPWGPGGPSGSGGPGSLGGSSGPGGSGQIYVTCLITYQFCCTLTISVYRGKQVSAFLDGTCQLLHRGFMLSRHFVFCLIYIWSYLIWYMWSQSHHSVRLWWVLRSWNWFMWDSGSNWGPETGFSFAPQHCGLAMVSMVTCFQFMNSSGDVSL